MKDSLQLSKPPAVEDADVEWVSELMGLGPNGFGKVGNDDSRLLAIKNTATADFEACPGSGKTTMLVAKLALLAKHWRPKRQGICVLSHTNAARNEIGMRLGSTPIGGALLHKPHFVGTIHSFVNEYLAIPWLRSKGNPVVAIDTQIALRHRMGLVPHNYRAAMSRRYLTETALEYDTNEYTGNNKGNLSPNSPTVRAMNAAAKASSEAGYFCFDEMFVWANELLDSRPDVASVLRARFPFVFIDEAQDNSEVQSALLFRIFFEGSNASRRQRFGDSNQAIYRHAEQRGASTDSFPGPTKFDLPRSYRFNQVIADQAKGLGVAPQALVGSGPSKARIKAEPKKSTLLLFDDDSVRNVLPSYAELLLDEFTHEELQAGTFVAVAGVRHSDEVEPIPRAIKDYMPTYAPVAARGKSSMMTFAHYLGHARHEMATNGDVFPIVYGIANAVLHLAAKAGSDFRRVGRSPHKLILELLEGQTEDYNVLVETIVAKKGELSKGDWEAQGRGLVISVASAITGTALKSNDDFLDWPDAIAGSEGEVGENNYQTTDSLFSYPHEEPAVNIRLGSIHSVKGETHTSTLVLESFFHKHHLSALKPWLLGLCAGDTGADGKPVGIRMRGRLRLHYVAMTRPTHLLCLAMRKDEFSSNEVSLMESAGWRVSSI